MIEVHELGSVPLLRTLSDDELRALARGAGILDVPDAGIELTREGEFGHCVFAIVSGTATVTSDGTLLRELGPGDVFGEIAVVSSGRRTATVTSTSPMRLISIFKSDLWRVADKSPEFDVALRRVTSRSAG